MTDAQKILMENPSPDFATSFCRVTGVFDGEAKGHPDRTYTVAELRDLFDYLYHMEWEKDG